MELRGYIADLRYYWTHTNTHVNSKWVSDRTRVNNFILTNIRPETHKTRRAQTIWVHLRLIYAFVSSVCHEDDASVSLGESERQQRCALVSKVAWNEHVFSTRLTGKQLKQTKECRVDGSRPTTAPSGGGSGQHPSQGQVHTVMKAVMFVKGIEHK